MFFFFQAEDGIRDLVRSRGLGDVYKRQILASGIAGKHTSVGEMTRERTLLPAGVAPASDTFAAAQISNSGKERSPPVSYTHLRAHETVLDLVCRLLLEKKKQ